MKKCSESGSSSSCHSRVKMSFEEELTAAHVAMHERYIPIRYNVWYATLTSILIQSKIFCQQHMLECMKDASRLPTRYKYVLCDIGLNFDHRIGSQCWPTKPGFWLTRLKFEQLSFDGVSTSLVILVLHITFFPLIKKTQASVWVKHQETIRWDFLILVSSCLDTDEI